MEDNKEENIKERKEELLKLCSENRNGIDANELNENFIKTYNGEIHLIAFLKFLN